MKLALAHCRLRSPSLNNRAHRQHQKRHDNEAPLRRSRNNRVGRHQQERLLRVGVVVLEVLTARDVGARERYGE